MYMYVRTQHTYLRVDVCVLSPEGDTAVSLELCACAHTYIHVLVNVHTVAYVCICVRIRLESARRNSHRILIMPVLGSDVVSIVAKLYRT